MTQKIHIRRMLNALPLIIVLCITYCTAAKRNYSTLPVADKGAFAWNIPFVDFADDIDKQVIVDKVKGKYLGQPDTVLLADGKTIIAGYPEGHGRPNTLLKKSTDGGITWSDRLPTPANFTGNLYAPALHRLTDPEGKERIVILVVTPRLMQSISEDNGKTWTPFKPIFDEEMKGKPGNAGNAPPKSVFKLKDGSYMALWHQHVEKGNMIWKIKTLDGGLTWTRPEKTVSEEDGMEYLPCAPAVIRSPYGDQLLCMMRSYDKSRHSATIMTSKDEGRTWSRLKELPGVYMGVRHILRYGPDGRIVAVFRDFNDDSPTHGDCVGWVGVYEDIVKGRPGQYRLRLLDNQSPRAGDTGYQGLEVLADGTVVMTTYCSMTKNEPPCVVSVRFTMDDIDRKAQAQGVATSQVPRGYSIPVVDISTEKDMQVVVDKIEGQYLGQPDTLLMPDGKTMFAVYPKYHGGHGPRPETFIKKSTDGGLTWGGHIITPDSFRKKQNAPVIHRLVDPEGTERLFVTVSWPEMRQSYSQDGGRTWSEFKPMFDEKLKGMPGFTGYAPPKSIMRLKDGKYIALYHDHIQERPRIISIVQTETRDGGLSWSEPRIVSKHPDYPGAHPCEPGLIRSPDGKQIMALCRENSRKYNSMFMVSNDEAKTWSDLKEMPGSLTGDRHVGQYAMDGRLIVVFRDLAHISDTRGDYVAWIGTYEDILQRREGSYRAVLLDNLDRFDAGYSGFEILPDGTLVGTTYGHWEKGVKPYILSVRFKIDQLDIMLKSGNE